MNRKRNRLGKVLFCLLAVAVFGLMPMKGTALAGDTLPPLLLQDRLLFLDSMTKIWNMNVRSFKAGDQQTLGHIVSILAVDYLNCPGKVYKEAIDEAAPDQRNSLELLFAGIPNGFNIYIPFQTLQDIAMEWLGCTLDEKAFAGAEDILAGKKGVYVCRDAFYEPGGRMSVVSPDEAFATLAYFHKENGLWVMSGSVRRTGMREDGIPCIKAAESFLMELDSADGRLRIHSLRFDNIEQ
ncbi:MAG: hypothetical protein ACI4P0_05440 [Mailhella sp.]